MNQKSRQENPLQTFCCWISMTALFPLYISVPNFYTNFTAVPYALPQCDGLLPLFHYKRSVPGISSMVTTSMPSPPYSSFWCFFLYFTHSVSRYSICPFIERKSSSAHWAISFHRVADSLKGTCFFAFSFPFALFSFSRMCHRLTFLIDASAVYNGLRVFVSAQYHQKIADHGSLSLFVQLYNFIFV